MKRLLLLSLITLAGTLAGHAFQPTAPKTGIKNNTFWTNTDLSFKATVKGSLVIMEGGSCHEGGYRFALRQQGNNTYTLINHPDDDPSNSYTPVHASLGCKVMVQRYDNTDCIVFYGKNNQPSDVLKHYDGNLRREIQQALYTDLEGRYNHPGGEQLTFAGNKCALATNEPLRSYTFVDVYETPTNTFRTANGQFFTYRPSIQGIDLYRAKINPQDEDDIQDGDCIGQLEKVIGDVDNGRWSYTADKVVTRGMLGLYNKYLLRVMRNEIYARHGWHFDDAYLREHFSSQWWYKDLHNNAAVKLSDTELLNIAIIKSMEDSMED